LFEEVELVEKMVIIEMVEKHIESDRKREGERRFIIRKLWRV